MGGLLISYPSIDGEQYVELRLRGVEKSSVGQTLPPYCLGSHNLKLSQMRSQRPWDAGVEKNPHAACVSASMN